MTEVICEVCGEKYEISDPPSIEDECRVLDDSYICEECGGI